jgi:hypothetical protein
MWELPPDKKECAMSDDPKTTNEPEPESERDDESRLDDLDPEEEGEDVLGGGAPPRYSSSRSNYA